MRRLLALALLLPLAACDTDAPGVEPLTFQGVDVVAVGDARLSVEAGRLVVSGLEGANEGGFRVVGALAATERVDVEIEPLPVPAGGYFGSRVEAADGSLVARFDAEGRGNGVSEFVVDFADRARTATARYRFNGTVLFTLALRDPFRSASARRPQSTGEGEGETGSTHVVREGGKYVVASDSNGGGSRRAGPCPGYRFTPPVGAVLPDGSLIDGGLVACVDWIEVEPEADAMPDGEVLVTARGVGRFTVESLARR